MALLVAVFAECGTLPFPRTPARDEYAMTYSLSQEGVEDFIMRGMLEALYYTQMMEIPDIHLNLPIWIFSFNVDIKNIRITELSTGGVNAHLADEAKSIPAALQDVDLVISMEWHVLEDQSPFLEDGGTGAIKVRGVNMTVDISTEMDDTCPGHFTINSGYTRLVFKKLSVELNSEHSDILELFMDLILDSLQDTLSELISTLLETAIEGILGKMLPENGYYLEHYDNPEIIKDMRFVNNVEIMNHMATFVFSAYTYHGEHLDDEYMVSHELSPFAFNKYNEKSVFAIHEEGFNNNFYIFHKYFDSFSNEEFTALEPPRLKFENIAARISVIVEYEARKYEFELKGRLVTRLVENLNFDATKINTTLISFSTTCIFVSNEDEPRAGDQEICEKYASWFDGANRKAEYQINNTPFMATDTYQVVYDSQEHVVRLMGDVAF